MKPKRIELPERPEPATFTLTIKPPLFGTHSEAIIRYDPSEWYSWQKLRERGELRSLVGSSSGVYEVVRGWHASDTKLFLYVGLASPGKLRDRLGNLLRQQNSQKAVHSNRMKIVSCAKKALDLADENDVLSWLYVRWTRCTHPLAPIMLEYYLHTVRDPEYPDSQVASQQKKFSSGQP